MARLRWHGNSLLSAIPQLLILATFMRLGVVEGQEAIDVALGGEQSAAHAENGAENSSSVQRDHFVEPTGTMADAVVCSVARACDNAGTCNTITGECSCIPGYGGAMCEKILLPGCRYSTLVNGQGTISKRT